MLQDTCSLAIAENTGQESSVTEIGNLAVYIGKKLFQSILGHGIVAQEMGIILSSL